MAEDASSFTPKFEPGPEEQKLRNRLYYKMFGVWPDSVVRERLVDLRLREIETQRRMTDFFKDMYDG